MKVSSRGLKILVSAVQVCLPAFKQISRFSPTKGVEPYFAGKIILLGDFLLGTFGYVLSEMYIKALFVRFKELMSKIKDLQNSNSNLMSFQSSAPFNFSNNLSISHLSLDMDIERAKAICDRLTSASSRSVFNISHIGRVEATAIAPVLTAFYNYLL